MTSGCPSIREVDRINEQIPTSRPGRTNPSPYKNSPELKRQLFASFDGAQPNLGYYCLASLGRQRKALIINLNWDDMVETAAEALNIECASFDIEEDVEEILSRWKSLETGLLVLHVHGRMNGEIRYTRNQRLDLSPAQRECVDDLLAADRLIAIGTSLRDDPHVNALLRDSGSSDPGYYFNRTDEEADANDQIARSESTGSLFSGRQWVKPDFDFDEFMLRFVASYRTSPYDDLISEGNWSQLGLPALSETELPDPAILRFALSKIFEKGIAILDAPPMANELACGSVLAHCLEVCHPREETTARISIGPDHVMAALASPRNTSDIASLLLAFPFGEDAFEANATFLPTLVERSLSVESDPPVIVCCERTKLDQAVNSNPALADFIDGLRLKGTPWFSEDRLKTYAEERGRTEVLHAILNGDVNTPLAVDAWKFGETPAFDDQVEYLYRELCKHREFANVCCIAYILKFVSPLPFVRYASRSSLDVSLLAQFLSIYEFEGVEYARVRNELASSAIEKFLCENILDFGAWLRSAFPSWRRARTALERFDRVMQKSDTAFQSTSAIESSSTTLHLLNAGTPQRASEYLGSCSDDWWATTECCYEIVRCWPALRNQAGWGNWIENTINTDTGLYGLLEAVLYYGQSTHPELWPRIHSQLWRQLNFGETISNVVCLCVDALLWRSPEMPINLNEWVHHALGMIDEHSKFHGLFAFEAAYHAEGFQTLDETLRSKADSPLTKEHAEFAAWMVRWHYAHQSFMRIHQSRLGFHDKEFLCRTLYPAGDKTNDSIKRLVTELAGHRDTAGWGFHAGSRWLDDQAIDDSLKRAALRALENAREQDLGVTTGLIAYPVTQIFKSQLTEIFASDATLLELRRTMRNGWSFDTVDVQPPKYEICTNPLRVYGTISIEFPQLTRTGSLEEWNEFRRRLDEAASQLLREQRVDPAVLDAKIEDALSGDLTELESVAVAMDATNPLIHALEVLCHEIPQSTDLFDESS